MQAKRDETSFCENWAGAYSNLGLIVAPKKCLQLWRSLMRPFSPAGCEEKYQYFEIISDHSINIKCFRFR